MAWAQNLLGLCFFACAPQAPFSWVLGRVLLCFCLFSVGLDTISLFLVGSKSNVSAFFRLQFRNGLGTKPAGALLFRMRSPSTFFLGFALFLLIFSGFLKQRFGIFQAAVSQWLEHKTCWGSAFSHALPKHLFLGSCFVFIMFLLGSKSNVRHFSGCGFHGLGAISLFLVGSKSNVSAFFRLQFRNRFGTKTCWGSAFSHALPKHLFLWFCLVFACF